MLDWSATETCHLWIHTLLTHLTTIKNWLFNYRSTSMPLVPSSAALPHRKQHCITACCCSCHKAAWILCWISTALCTTCTTVVWWCEGMSSPTSRMQRCIHGMHIYTSSLHWCISCMYPGPLTKHCSLTPICSWHMTSCPAAACWQSAQVKNIMFLTLCASHMMKAMSMWILKAVPNSNQCAQPKYRY